MNEGNSRGVNVDKNMLTRATSQANFYLRLHSPCVSGFLKTPQGPDEPPPTPSAARSLKAADGLG